MLELTFPASTLVDFFDNTPASLPAIPTFPWQPTGTQVVTDTATPELLEACIVGGKLRLTFSETPDTTTAPNEILLDGTTTTWTALADGYTLETTTAITAGSHTVTFGTGSFDLDGKSLAATGQLDFQSTDTHIWAAPYPGEIGKLPNEFAARSTANNPFGWKGRPVDPETGLIYIRHRYYDPDMGRFITPDPLGYVDGPSVYGFGMNSPVSYGDPLGLTSRSDITSGTLFYTWHLGWIDLGHVQTPALHDPWTQLRNAQPGEEVTFTISLDQGASGHPLKKFLAYKKSSATFRVTAGPEEQIRKRQLLWAWKELSEQFERHQGTGPQGWQWFNSLGGRLTGEKEKIGSSFSTEDLISNLLGFYATVEGLTWEEAANRVSGRLGSEEKEFSLLVWDCTDFGIEMHGNRTWTPQYLELKAPKSGCEAEHDRLLEIYFQYLKDFGKPRFPEELQIEPEPQGVEILSRENQ